MGDGIDRIMEGQDAASLDVLKMGGGVAAGDLSITRSIDDLVISLPDGGDQVILVGWFSVQGGTIERVEFSDGDVWSAAELESRVTYPNQPPEVLRLLADQMAVEDELFAYVVPLDAFTDSDPGDSLTYEATLQDGSGLPAWLSFDASTQTFSGTPLNSDVGVQDILVAVTDRAGAQASDVFRLEVSNTNDAPIVAQPLPDLAAVEGNPFSFTISPGTFLDPDIGDALSYAADFVSGAGADFCWQASAARSIEEVTSSVIRMACLLMGGGQGRRGPARTHGAGRARERRAR